MSRAAASILDLVGQTPTVTLSRIPSAGGASVHLKLELLSPTGSLKDRVAVAAVAEAFASGLLKEGGALVEPTLGNSAVSIAFACATRKVSVTAVIPDSASLERRALLRAYGVKLVLTPAEEGLSGAIRRAQALREATPGAVTLGLHEGKAALEVHGRTTAQELVATVREDGGRIDAFVAGVGSGATLSACARALKGAWPAVKVVAVEPANRPAPNRMQELARDLPPPALQGNLLDQTVSVADADAWAMKLRLGKEEGLLVGISTGASVVAAVALAAKLPPGARVYTLACDTGEREFSLAEQFK